MSKSPIKDKKDEVKDEMPKWAYELIQQQSKLIEAINVDRKTINDVIRDMNEIKVNIQGTDSNSTINPSIEVKNATDNNGKYSDFVELGKGVVEVARGAGLIKGEKDPNAEFMQNMAMWAMQIITFNMENMTKKIGHSIGAIPHSVDGVTIA